MNLVDLTLALVITSNMIISCQSASTHFFKKNEVHPQKVSVSDRKHMLTKSELPESYYQNADYYKRPKRADLLRKWSILPIRIQLNIALDRYHDVNQKMEELYYAVIGCGPNGCQNFKHFIPRPDHRSNGNIFNKRKRHLGKKIFQLLDDFHNGLQKIEKSFNLMLKYENITGYLNKVRQSLLQDFRNDLTTLNMEVESSMSLKTDEFFPISEDVVSCVFPFPPNRSDLIIQEWYVIQGSKRYLTEWQKIFNDLELQTKILKGPQRKRCKKLSRSKSKSRMKAKMRKNRMKCKPKKS